MFSHMLLRPIGNRINKINFQKPENATYIYSFRIRCKEEVENHLRVLILYALKHESNMQLRSLKSNDDVNPSFVFIEAEILANGKHDIQMEKLAGNITLESGVTQVSWEINGQQGE
ncbi:MAG: hypothetical protein SNJ77_06825 [Cytophagales bacterium]